MSQPSTRYISQQIAADADGEAGAAMIIIDAVVAMIFELSNTGANPLTGLKIQLRAIIRRATDAIRNIFPAPKTPATKTPQHR